MSIIHQQAQVDRWQQSLNDRRSTWIKKANEVHGGKFDYSHVLYENSHSKVKISCPDHGIFVQKACDHTIQKQGCPKCSHNYPLTHEQFERKSKEKFGDKFSFVSEYRGIKHPLTIRCIYHGEFTLPKAEGHLKRDGCCPGCRKISRIANLNTGRSSKAEKRWLDSMSVPLRQHHLVVEGELLIVDGYDPNTNTVYECHGSYWHGNPNKYPSESINTRIGKTFGELYERTMAKEALIRKHHNLVTTWV